ncbi:MAG: 1-deoxy-D-xylulose-5-phosphate synthase [Nocardioidaceae bacterium]|jgi:1-deoxy-D-xylulose-5-phosphate synthase|nr:1-deoxy-D-xylulose-5-phosphate synthase [Nocardioidaceae bacterium]
MSLLDTVQEPRDLRDLDDQQLTQLAAEIRAFLIDKVSKTGGHLGPNLGVVELTIAIHRVFESPRDRVVFDTGHQAYVHKILTGRAADFDRLKQEGGLSGYPNQGESPHDIVENSHASTSLSYADGLAKAYHVQGDSRHVVAVIGDGALTGGMAWEALNNISAAPDSRLVIVVNDNGRSYSPTVGGLANHLASLRTDPRYEQTLDMIKTRLTRTKLVGPPLYDALHAIKKGLKDALAPQGMFEDLGLKYVGPVDGHDVSALEQALSQAKNFGGPVIVHTITKKGFGYPPAEQHEEDNYHSLGIFDAGTGAVSAAAPSYVDVFRAELVALGVERPDLVAVTAAMLYPTGLDGFQRVFPERTFDVGIAEQHAVTSAAGMAMAGLHPVVAIYATFLNRAFDQVLLDAALHRCGITFVLDRAGVTGEDGPSHHGMWDMSMLQLVPGLRLAAPRDATRFRELLREAVAVSDAPTVLRVPKGAVPEDIPAVASSGGLDVLARAGAKDVLIVAVGALAGACVDAADRLQAQGIGVTVVDPRWVKPVNPALLALAREHSVVASVEDNGRVGGCGSALAQALSDIGADRPVLVFGIPQEFVQHGKRDAVLERVGLSGPSLARDITARVAALDHSDAPQSEPTSADTA